MELFVYFFQSGVFDVGVNLRRLNAGVTEQFLDLSEVRAAGQQVRGEAVSQAVRADLGVDADASCVQLDQTPKLDSIQRPTAP